MKFLKAARLVIKSAFRLKNMRLGLALLNSSLQTIFFNHSIYFIFCLFLCIIQIFFVIGLISIHSFSFDYFFLNMLQIDDFIISIIAQLFSTPSHIVMVTAPLIFFILCLKNLIFFWVTIYTIGLYTKSTQSLHNSFKKSILKINKIIQWSILEICFYTIIAPFSVLSFLFQLIWYVNTFFIIPLMITTQSSIMKNMYRSGVYFITSLTSILTAEFFFETLVFIISLALYQIYIVKEPIINDLSYILTTKNILITAFIFYGSSLIAVGQTVLISYLFMVREKN